MGADAAFHVELPETAPAPEPLGVAKAVQAIIEKQENSVDMVILGKQSIDDDLGQTGQMLAGLLDWGQATYASKVDLDLEQKNAVITREIDGGLEQVCVKFPLIVTTDLRLNGAQTIISFLSSNQTAFFRASLCFIAQYYES